MRDAYRRILDRRKALFYRFVDRRIATSDTHRLSQKNLFIFPTKRGFIFFSIIAVLWVLGTNYQNNLILALAFFMISVFVLAITLTFQNLNRLVVSFRGHSGDIFATSPASLRFIFSKAGKHGAEEVQLAWQSASKDESEEVLEATAVYYVTDSEQEHLVPWFTDQRGYKKLPRLRVQSSFPLGIIRTWTWLRFNAEAIVFPQPVNGRVGKSASSSEGEADGLHAVKGGDDFSGLNDYIAGDSIKRVYWKSFARGRGMHVKEFAESTSQEVWLDYNAVQANSVEERLSVLTFWVLQYYQDNETFGLNLPTENIAPGLGKAHRDKCLIALAAF